MSLVDNNCPDCGHSKIQHVTALGYCVNCMALDLHGMPNTGCRRWFASIFSQDELEKLTHVAKDSFGQWDMCAVCECYWMEHCGALCPNGNTTFKPLVGYV